MRPRCGDLGIRSADACRLLFHRSAHPLNTPAYLRRMVATGTKRTFPPPYVSTKDAAKDRLAFFHILERLKTQKRQGWLNHNIPGPESIADHMYRMSIMAMCAEDPNLDVGKCVMLAVVHDLAEAHVGDITPSEGIPREEKQRREAEAIENFVQDMLHESPAAQRIRTLWMAREYEAGETAEARFVKDLDRMELGLQTVEYEEKYHRDDFDHFLTVLPQIRHPEVQEWRDSLLEERERIRGQSSS